MRYSSVQKNPLANAKNADSRESLMLPLAGSAAMRASVENYQTFQTPIDKKSLSSNRMKNKTHQAIYEEAQRLTEEKLAKKSLQQKLRQMVA